MPVIRYVCFVGPLLLGLLFLLAEPPANIPAADRWTAIDSLRALAHPGQQVEGHDRFVRVERVSSEPADRKQSAERSAQAKPSIIDAQARMEPAEIESKKPRKQKIANRKARLRTAVAENFQQVPEDRFRPPSW